MAWSVANVSAADQSNLALDYPILIGTQAAESFSAGRWNGVGDTATADDVATGYPVKRIYDRKLSPITKPATARTTQYLVLDLATTVAAFDMILIGGHNFGTIGADGNGALTVTVDIADDATFATNLKEIVSFSPGTSNKRLVSFSLGHDTDAAPNQYSGARFLRVKITRGAGTFTPEIGELWLGKRRQLATTSLMGYHAERQESGRTEYESDNGTINLYSRHRAKAVKALRLLLTTAAEKTDIETWWSEAKQGTRPVLFCEKPSSAPSDTQFMLAPSAIEMVGSSTTVFSWSPEFRETEGHVALET